MISPAQCRAARGLRDWSQQDLARGRDEAISRLQQHEADLKRLGVEHLYTFGSTARDEAGTIPTLTFFSIMKKASSVCSS